MNIAKFLRTPFLAEHLWWLLCCYKNIREFSSLTFLVAIVLLKPKNGTRKMNLKDLSLFVTILRKLGRRF